MGETREFLRFSGKVAVRALMTLSLVALLFMGIGPRFLGYQTMTVLTGSMQPRIPAGSVVVVMPAPVGDVQPGDMITFNPPTGDGRVVTHRVVTVEDDFDAIIVTTKGDANELVDPWRARITGPSVYRVRWVIPSLGRFIALLRVRLLNRLLVFAVPLILAMIWLAQIWSKPNGSRAVRPGGAHA